MWRDSIKYKPSIGDSILVKTTSGQVFYAVYSNEDEFDVHRPNNKTESRLSWYKYSSRTIIKWRYFTSN
jgi:hypothetical protein